MNHMNPLLFKPSLSRLNLEDITEFALHTQNIAPTDIQKEEINNLLSTNKSLIELAVMVHEFIEIKDNLAARPGLTNKQFEKLRSLMEERNQLKLLRQKNKYNIPISKAIIENAKNIQPLQHILYWWTNATKKLNESDIWEDSIAIYQRSHATKNQLAELMTIKKEWEWSSAFSGYSSKDLLHFYQNYVLTLEDKIERELQTKHELPTLISSYLEANSIALKAIKKSIIASMLYRLRCAEYYNDSKCDDLIAYTCDRLQQQDRIKLSKHGNIPPRRRSLDVDIIPGFLQCIQQYCQTTPEETDLAKILDQLRVNSRPDQTETPTHPAILYFINTFPALLEEAHKQKDLTMTLLQSDGIKDKSFILNLLKNNLRHAIIAYQMQHASLTFYNNQHNKYLSLLKEISMKMQIDIQEKINAIIENSLGPDEIDDVKLKTIFEQIERANLFHQKYLNQDYVISNDVIVALAYKIKEMLGQQQPITLTHCQRLFELLKKTCPDAKKEQLEKLNEKLLNLSHEAQKLTQAKQAEILHFLINYLEAPLLTKDTLAIALQRHKEIAKLHHEKWVDSIVYADAPPINNESLNTVALYIKNVLLNLVNVTPSLDLDSFDENDLLTILDDIKNNLVFETLIPEQPCSTPYCDHFNFIKDDLEKNILKKLNDVFSIQHYLYQEQNHCVNLEKLKDLLNRSHRFFSDTEKSALLHKTIKQACLSLATTYCILCIEQNVAPNMDYLKELDAILGATLLPELRYQKELKDILRNYIDTFSGDNNHFADLVLALLPPGELCVRTYVEKRLRYIKAHMTASKRDYAFFYFFCSEPSIANLFNECKKSILISLQSLANNTASPWEEKLAVLIELFCDEDWVIAYRQKHLLELTEKATAPNNDEESNALFSVFLDTINHARAIKKYGNSDLYEQLNNAIDKQPWSMLLENIVTHCGHYGQRWQLHYKHLTHYLNDSLNFTHEWIGQEIANKTAMMPDEIANTFFLTFFGAKYIKQLCNKIDHFSQILIKAHKTLGLTPLSETNYQALKQLIECIKPLSRLYQLYGDNKTTKNLFLTLDEIERKIYLHYKLSSIAKQNMPAIVMENGNLKLQNLILSIIQSIYKMTCGEWPEQQDINKYLSYLCNATLSDLENFMATNKSDLHFKDLSAISNLVFYLTSSELKQLLLIANKDNLEKNPYWLRLINHLSDGYVIRDIEESPYDFYSRDSGFHDVFLFAKRLTTIKRMTNQAIKRCLLVEAGITPLDNESTNLSTIIHEKKIKDTALIKLWSVCIKKLQQDHLTAEVKPPYLYFMIKFLIEISDAILLQARNNPALLHRFMKLFHLIPIVKDGLQHHVSHLSKSEKLSSTLWADIPDTEKILFMLGSIVDRSFALSLMQKIETYVSKKIPEANLLAFKAIGENPLLGDKTETLSLDVGRTKTALGIKNDIDTQKVIGMIKVYAKLSLILRKGQGMQSLPRLIKNIVEEAKLSPDLVKAKNYLQQLDEIRRLSEKYFVAKNDNHFLTTPVNQSTIMEPVNPPKVTLSR
jgi:hypothetical protein